MRRSPAIKPPPISHSSNFAPVLAQFSCALLVSTFQAGQMCGFGTHKGNLHNEPQPSPLAMGIAVRPRRVAVERRPCHAP